MQCKNHADRPARHFCASCGIPLCADCAEESKPGIYHCFQCAMLTSISDGGTRIQDRKERAVEGKLKERKKWGPFRYFTLSSAVLILVMWGVILFGGEKPPAATTNLASNPRAFLFMVDSSIKRFAHYEKKGYPEELSDLVPKYLRMDNGSRDDFRLLSYQKDPKEGYRLSLAKKAPGEKVVILSPKGVQYESAGGGV